MERVDLVLARGGRTSGSGGNWIGPPGLVVVVVEQNSGGERDLDRERQKQKQVVLD